MAARPDWLSTAGRLVTDDPRSSSPRRVSAASAASTLWRASRPDWPAARLVPGTSRVRVWRRCRTPTCARWRAVRLLRPAGLAGREEQIGVLDDPLGTPKRSRWRPAPSSRPAGIAAVRPHPRTPARRAAVRGGASPGPRYGAIGPVRVCCSSRSSASVAPASGDSPRARAISAPSTATASASIRSSLARSVARRLSCSSIARTTWAGSTSCRLVSQTLPSRRGTADGETIPKAVPIVARARDTGSGAVTTGVVKSTHPLPFRASVITSCHRDLLVRTLANFRLLASHSAHPDLLTIYAYPGSYDRHMTDRLGSSEWSVSEARSRVAQLRHVVTHRPGVRRCRVVPRSV